MRKEQADALIRKEQADALMRKEQADPLMFKEQAGYRKGKSCGEHIFTLRQIVEQCQEWNTPVYADFVDFESSHALDSWLEDSTGRPKEKLRISVEREIKTLGWTWRK